MPDPFRDERRAYTVGLRETRRLAGLTADEILEQEGTHLDGPFVLNAGRLSFGWAGRNDDGSFMSPPPDISAEEMRELRIYRVPTVEMVDVLRELADARDERNDRRSQVRMAAMKLQKHIRIARYTASRIAIHSAGVKSIGKLTAHNIQQRTIKKMFLDAGIEQGWIAHDPHSGVVASGGGYRGTGAEPTAEAVAEVFDDVEDRILAAVQNDEEPDPDDPVEQAASAWEVFRITRAPDDHATLVAKIEDLLEDEAEGR